MYAIRDDVVILLLLFIIIFLRTSFAFSREEHLVGALSFVSGYDCEKAIVHLRLRLRKSTESQVNFSKLLQCFFQDSEGTDTGTAWAAVLSWRKGRRAGFGVEGVGVVEGVALLSASALQWPTLLVKATMIIAGPVSKAAESNGNSNATRDKDDECYLPPGVGPGHPMQVNVDGRLMTVSVPQGVYSECSFSSQYQILLPHSSSMLKCKTEALFHTTKQIRGETSIQVTCPAGVTRARKLLSKRAMVR